MDLDARSCSVSSQSVSIVVNNYNYARFLRGAIESALTQTYPNTEVVVVDDGSTDESRAIIEDFEDHITPVFKENGGQASALNAGFVACGGEIVIFLDADDLLMPYAAERIAVAWKPGVAWVQNPVAIIDEGGRHIGSNVPIAKLSASEMEHLLLQGFQFERAPTSGCAFARTTLSQLLPMCEPDFRVSADLYLCTLAPFLGETVIIGEPLGCYRIHSGNSVASAEFNINKVRAGLQVSERMSREFKAFATRRKFDVADDWLFATPVYTAARLASFLAGSEGHPYPADTRFDLVLRGMRAASRHPLLSTSKRLSYLAWFGMASIMPQLITRRLIGARSIGGGFVRRRVLSD